MEIYLQCPFVSMMWCLIKHKDNFTFKLLRRCEMLINDHVVRYILAMWSLPSPTLLNIPCVKLILLDSSSLTTEPKGSIMMNMILSQFNPVQTHTTYFPNIHFNIMFMQVSRETHFNTLLVWMQKLRLSTHSIRIWRSIWSHHPPPPPFIVHIFNFKYLFELMWALWKIKGYFSRNFHIRPRCIQHWAFTWASPFCTSSLKVKILLLVLCLQTTRICVLPPRPYFTSTHNN
jgi:hypothetical protein